MSVEKSPQNIQYNMYNMAIILKVLMSACIMIMNENITFSYSVLTLKDRFDDHILSP